jgi:hypothetical protein
MKPSSAVIRTRAELPRPIGRPVPSRISGWLEALDDLMA